MTVKEKATGRFSIIYNRDVYTNIYIVSQEVYTWARELICPNLVCMVCMSVTLKKIAKLFFSVRSTQFPFKLNILFIKKYINLLGPKTLRLVLDTQQFCFLCVLFVEKICLFLLHSLINRRYIWIIIHILFIM